MSVKTKVKISKTFYLELEKIELISLLNSRGNKIPLDAEINIHIPGGGDWSNTDISLGNEFKAINIIWTELKEQNE